MDDEHPDHEHPDHERTREPTGAAPSGEKVPSGEALARSKDEVTPRFKEPQAPKQPSRWPAGRTIGRRPSKGPGPARGH